MILTVCEQPLSFRYTFSLSVSKSWPGGRSTEKGTAHARGYSMRSDSVKPRRHARNRSVRLCEALGPLPGPGTRTPPVDNRS
jgi:hypothetical protein